MGVSGKCPFLIKFFKGIVKIRRITYYEIVLILHFLFKLEQGGMVAIESVGPGTILKILNGLFKSPVLNFNGINCVSVASLCHLQGNQATDIMFDGLESRSLTSERFATTNTHGTGCTFSSAIAAHRAKGLPFFEAVTASKTYISGAIAHALNIGQGHGPTHHFFDLYQKAGIN